MAARKSSRGASAPVPSSLSDSARQHLQALLHTLRDIEGVAIVAAHALQQEEAFVGMCAARLLRTQVSDRLSLEIDRAAELFAIDLKTDRERES